MNQDLSIVSLILHASFAVQLVIAGLLLVSLASWSVIFGKLIGLGQIKRRNDAFEAEFWSGKNLNDLYQAVGNRTDGAPLERIFASGMREFLKLREKRVTDSGTPAVRCAPASSASWTRWSTTCPSWRRWGRCRPMSACSARSGESCMPSSACPT
jgi:biopolymer transport protein TolQ